MDETESGRDGSACREDDMDAYKRTDETMTAWPNPMPSSDNAPQCPHTQERRMPAPLMPKLTKPDDVAARGNGDMERLCDIPPYSAPTRSAGCLGFGGKIMLETWHDSW